MLIVHIFLFVYFSQYTLFIFISLCILVLKVSVLKVAENWVDVAKIFTILSLVLLLKVLLIIESVWILKDLHDGGEKLANEH